MEDDYELGSMEKEDDDGDMELEMEMEIEEDPQKVEEEAILMQIAEQFAADPDETASVASSISTPKTSRKSKKDEEVRGQNSA